MLPVDPVTDSFVDRFCRFLSSSLLCTSRRLYLFPRFYLLSTISATSPFHDTLTIFFSFPSLSTINGAALSLTVPFQPLPLLLRMSIGTCDEWLDDPT